MTNLDVFRKFCREVLNGATPSIISCTPEDQKECLGLLDTALSAQVFFNEKRIQSKLRGVGDVGKNGFSLTIGNYQFTVNPPAAKKQPMKKGVSDSSREAYHSIDPRGQALTVAKTAARLTKEFGFVTDNQIAQVVGIPAARVSARRAEIEGPVGIRIDGLLYYFETKGRVKCPVSSRSVNGWGLSAKKEPEAQGCLF